MDARHRLWLSAATPAHVAPVYEPTIPGELAVSGRWLIIKATGQKVYPVGVSAFPAAHLWLEDQRDEISAFCDWMDVCGLEELRTFGQWILDDFLPARYGDRYYSGLEAFADWLAARPRPLRLKVVALTSGREIPQSEWVNVPRLAEALHGKARLSLGNEFPQNGFDPWAFSQPAGLVSARGSNLGDELPPFPMWDIAEFHSPRDTKRFSNVLCRSWVRSCKAANELRIGDNPPRWAYQRVELDEPIAWGPTQVDGRTDNDPFSAWQFGAGVRFFGGASVTCHYRPDHLSRLTVPDEVTTACATALVQGFHLPIGECADGSIRHSSGLHFANRDRFLDSGEVFADGTMDAYEAQVGSRIEGLALQPGAEWKLKVDGATVEQAFRHADEEPSVFVLRS